jgi:hypothetical protein
MKRISVGVVATALMLLAVGGTTQAHAQANGRGKAAAKPAPVPPAEQQRRVQQEQQRTTNFKQQLPHQVQTVQKQTAAIKAQKRPAQARVQQQYAAHLQEQQRVIAAPRDVVHEPYVTAPVNYRYVISGTARETNQYGVNMLRQAVNYGYQQGYAAGEADRADHWRSSYATAPAYVDANYGYTGSYVDQADYNYYFRQGFQRGYEDGYANQLRYGTRTGATAAILGTVLTGILGLVTIH